MAGARCKRDKSEEPGRAGVTTIGRVLWTPEPLASSDQDTVWVPCVLRVFQKLLETTPGGGQGEMPRPEGQSPGVAKGAPPSLHFCPSGEKRGEGESSAPDGVERQTARTATGWPSLGRGGGMVMEGNRKKKKISRH